MTQRYIRTLRRRRNFTLLLSRSVLNRLGAVALGPDHVARQLKSPPAQDGGRALQAWPDRTGPRPDALVSCERPHGGSPECAESSCRSSRSRQRPRLGVVEQDGFDRDAPATARALWRSGQRFRLEDGSASNERPPRRIPCAAGGLPPRGAPDRPSVRAWSSASLRRGTSGPLAMSAGTVSTCGHVALEDANTDALEDLLDRLDLVSANTQFRKPPAAPGHLCGLQEKAAERTRAECHEETGATRSCAGSHSRAPPRHQLRHHGSAGSPVRPPTPDLRLAAPRPALPDAPKAAATALLSRTVGHPREASIRGAFVGALGYQREVEYSDISTAVRAAAEQTVPLMRPAQKSLPATLKDAFERLLDERQQAAVNDAIRSITAAGPDVKSRAVWTAVRTLTGAKRRVALNLAGDTPEERRNELRDFFAGIVNAPASPLPPPALRLPLDTPLPAEEGLLHQRPVTKENVVLFARKTSGGKARSAPTKSRSKRCGSRCVALPGHRRHERTCARWRSCA
uniref:DUF4806 domain-containing protein n=1 Tax=Macrostomum lignano TaxID=282301 RepID=A0A1I8FPK8_9PLAT